MPLQEIHDREDWQEALALFDFPDIYFTHEYNACSLSLEPDAERATLLRFASPTCQAILPLILRRIGKTSMFDATSAYGYGGPLVEGALDNAALKRDFDDWARAHSVVAAFIRSHPLADNLSTLYGCDGHTELGGTVRWNTRPGRDIRGCMHSHHRRLANKADRSGVVVSIKNGADHLSEFRGMYVETMDRKNASNYYYFPDHYWNTMANLLSDDLVIFTGSVDSRPVASLLCFKGAGVLHYHLGATADEGRRLGASNRVFLAAAEWAQANGFATFHLGGAYGASDSSPLLTFKRRFDPTADALSFQTLKHVSNWSAYQDLAGTSSTEGFFPPWRGPSATV